MCVMSTPDMPEPTPPPQEVQTPDTPLERNKKRKASGMTAGGTILTGAGGLAPGASNTGGSTLLGG